MNAVDTNVLVYAVDAQEPVKQAKAIALIRNLRQVPSEPLLLWQVAGEYVSVLRRWHSAGRITIADVDAYAQQMLASLTLCLPRRNVIEISLSLSIRHSLSHWDSMLVAGCIDAGIDTLYSEDLGAGATYDSVRVVNPFI